MRVAIIGLPGTGKTALATVIARELRATTVTAPEELDALAHTTESLVLDGFPRTIAELHRIQAIDSPLPVVDRVILLSADSEVRARRISRTTATNPGPTQEHVSDDELLELGEQLDQAGLLIPINADGIEYKVMALAFEALDIRI